MAYCFNVEECNSGNHATLVRLGGSNRMGTYVCGNQDCLAKARAIRSVK